VAREALEALRGLGLAKQQELLLGRQGQRRRDHVREQARRRDVRDEGLPLLGIVVVQVDHLLGERDHALPDRARLGRVRREVCDRIDAHEQRGVVRGLGRDRKARADHADHDRLLAVAPRVDHAYHARDAGGRVEVRQAR
jgi:hypothetical protein